MAQARDSLDGLMRSIHTVVRASNRGAERMGIDKASMIVLYSLRDGGQVRPSAVAAFCGLDVSTISRHLKRLEDEGLIARSHDPLDRRAQLLTMTDRGYEILETLDETRRTALDQALGHWTEADRSHLAELLTRLADDLITSQARSDAGLATARA